jgi:hypothetical protein
MNKVMPKDTAGERETAMLRMRMAEAMIHYGLEGRAYEYSMTEDSVIVWATDTAPAPYILVRIR